MLRREVKEVGEGIEDNDVFSGGGGGRGGED